MSFFFVFVRTTKDVVLSGSVERVFKRARDCNLDSRTQQLWLALSSLAFAASFIIYFLAPLSGFVLFLFSGISRGESPPIWVFWLMENSWFGLGLGVLAGVLLRLVLRFSGVYFFCCAGLLLSGVASLGTAWGIFLGGFLLAAGENFWRFPGKEFRLRSAIALAFGLGGLVLAPWLQLSAANLDLAGYSAQLRWFQWAFLTFMFLAAETFVSLVFFHFYYGHSQRLTKV